MASKEKPNLPSKNKHYTPMERKVFLQILDDYKHVIEIKKSDSTTVKDKEITWNEICNRYNQSTLISQERAVTQLKKLWTNLKQTQREALTKERQLRLATGGGPSQENVDIDPDIANITPYLMKTAPVAFTSNMSNVEINEKRDFVFEVISDNQAIELFESDEDSYTHSNTETVQNSSIATEKNDTPVTVHEDVEDTLQTEQPSNVSHKKPKQALKRKRNTKECQLSNTENTLRIERIQRVIQ